MQGGMKDRVKEGGVLVIYFCICKIVKKTLGAVYCTADRQLNTPDNTRNSLLHRGSTAQHPRQH